MPELILYVRPTGSYDEGDCVEGFNRFDIRRKNAEDICFEKTPQGRLVGSDQNGLMEPGHVSQDWLEATRDYRLERLSATEADIVRLSDGQRIRIQDGVPHVDFEGYTSVTHFTYFARRRQAQGAPVFGTLGREIVYSTNRETVDDSRLNTIWAAIENKKQIPESSRPLWPMGTLDVRHFLVLPVEDFTAQERQELTEPQVNPQGDIVGKRKRRIPNWRGLLAQMGVTAQQVLDPDIAVDRRGQINPFNHRPLFAEKP